MTDTKDMLGRSVSRRGFLATSALAAASVAGSGSLLAACGSGSSGGPGGGTGGGGTGGSGGGSVTWGSWANPGEAERFKKYSQDYQQRTGTKVTYQTVTGDYLAKLLTQLAGGSAPDAFYIGDTQIAKLIESKSIMPLDDYLAKPDAAVKFEDTFPGLSQWCKGEDGKIYGIPVDCNPAVFWFNKKLLNEAGVTTDPAAQFNAGTWNLDALTDLLSKVKATGKKSLIIEQGWFNWWGLITSQGGTMLDESGKAVFDTDPKAKTAIEWMIEQLKNGNITYSGSLPKGQGVDALFYAGQLATITYGRWILPNLRKLRGKVEYDIAPFASEDGKTIAPTPVATAAMGVNAKAKDPEAAQKFLGNFVNAEGQKYRLSGGGNAVPSVPGLDEIVLEGNDPPNAKWFIDIAKAGYATPKPLYTSAQKNANWNKTVDSLLNPEPLKSTTPEKFSSTLVQFLNGA